MSIEEEKEVVDTLKAQMTLFAGKSDAVNEKMRKGSTSSFQSDELQKMEGIQLKLQENVTKVDNRLG
jgi:hypothetical protein